MMWRKFSAQEREIVMQPISRRQFGRTIATAAAAAGAGFGAAGKPNSNFHGVQIGVITYSFRALRPTAEQTLQFCLDCGISGVEMMSDIAERFAGAPSPSFGRPGAGGPPPGGGRPQMTPEQIEAMQRQLGGQLPPNMPNMPKLPDAPPAGAFGPKPGMPGLPPKLPGLGGGGFNPFQFGKKK